MAFFGNIWNGGQQVLTQLSDFHEEYKRLHHDSSHPLRNAIEKLKSLIDTRIETNEMPQELVGQTISVLEIITKCEAPEDIFNPNQEPNEEKRQEFLDIQQECNTLLVMLKHYNNSLFEKPDEASLSKEMNKVYTLLHKVHEESLGLVAKTLALGIDKVQEAVKKAISSDVESSKSQSRMTNPHPLMKLLDLLGKFDNTLYLADTREIALYNALFELNNYSPLFRGNEEEQGVLDYVLEGQRLPGNRTIFKKVSRFLRERISTHLEGEALENTLPKLIYTKHKGQFQVLAAEAKAIYLKVYELSETNEEDSEEDKLNRVRILIDGGIRDDYSDPLKAAIAQGLRVRKGERLAQLNGNEQLGHGRNAIALDIPPEWPEQSEDREIACATWMAVAQFEEAKKCEELQQQLISEDFKLENLASQFDLLISLFEKQPHLMKTPEESAAFLEELTHTIVGWVNLAMREMKNEKGISHSDIDTKFKSATQLIGKGKHLEALRYVQRLVEESSVGLKMWSKDDVASPANLFESALQDFQTIQLPTAPPKSSKEVKEKLEVDEIEKWDEAWEKVISLEQNKLITGTCSFAAFNLSMKYIVGMSDEKRESIYKKLVTAIDTIAGEDGNYDGDDLEARIKESLANILDVFSHEVKQQSIDEIVSALSEVQSAGYPPKRKAKELQETLYFSLLWEVVDQQEDTHFFTKVGAHGLIVVVYKLLEFFVRPFTHSILQSITEDVILPSNGALTETHLSPIKALGEALDSYTSAKKAWADLKKDQATGKISPHPDRNLVGRNEQEALGIILDSPTYYHGYHPFEIDQEIGYLAVDHFLQVADFCTRTQSWHDNITYNANIPVIDLTQYDENNQFMIFVNNVGIAIKKILSIIPHAAVYTIYLCLKMLEVLVNFLSKQLAKFAIWKWDIVTNLIEEMTNSLFKESYHTPVIDELVLDQLKELEEQILQDSQEERGGLLEHESPLIKRQIRGAFASLFESIEIDSKDTSQEVEDHGSNPTTRWVKIQIKSQLKELLTSLLVVSSQSFLNQNQMNELLLKVLDTANRGLRGNETTLTPTELDRLHQRLGRNPTPSEINNEARRLHGELQGEINTRLNNILDNGVNPVIQRAIETYFESPSDRLFNYASWMERRLFSYPGKGLASERNIIHMLRRHMEGFLEKPPKEQGAVLRQIHEEYSTFIQEFIAKQANMDGGRIPNALKLNKLIKTDLEPLVKNITNTLMTLINEKEDKGPHVETLLTNLQTLENKLIEKRETLNKIKRAEQSRVEGMRQGIGGWLKSGTDTLKEVTRVEAIPIAQSILNHTIRRLTTDSATLYKNPNVIRHVVRYQALNILERHGRA